MTVDPARQVFILHNDDARDAAVHLLGVQAFSSIEVDWHALAGCRLVLWPANTRLSLLAMGVSADVAHRAGATSIRIIQPGPLTADGWSAINAAEEDWPREDTIEWLRQHAVDWSPTADQPLPDVRTEAEITGETPPPMAASAAPARQQQARGTAWDAAAPMADRWAMLGLETTKTGPLANEDNVLRVLERHPDLANICWYDEFLGRIMTAGPTGDREWSDADDVRLTASLQRDLGISRTKVSHVRAAVIGHAMSRVRNCAREWIASLKWDGIERIAAFFPDSFGAPDTAYSRAVGRNFWISMVARVFRPGCKVDTMVILEGGQGAGKSSVLKAIAGDWFTVQHESITGKGFFEVLQGKMLVEIAEMDAFGKAEVTRVKQVVSTEVDRYRESYGRYAKDHPRHSIFVGTTNKDDWNRDETGARRFWPIRCVGAIDLQAVGRVRCQLFAEALAALNGGATWWEMPDAETKAEQDARREEDPWTSAVEEWLGDIYRQEVLVEDILTDCIQLRRGDQGKVQQMRVGSILRGLGWTKKNSAGRRYWSRPKATT